MLHKKKKYAPSFGSSRFEIESGNGGRRFPVARCAWKKKKKEKKQIRSRQEKRNKDGQGCKNDLLLGVCCAVLGVNAARMVYLIPQWPVGLRD